MHVHIRQRECFALVILAETNDNIRFFSRIGSKIQKPRLYTFQIEYHIFAAVQRNRKRNVRFTNILSLTLYPSIRMIRYLIPRESSPPSRNFPRIMVIPIRKCFVKTEIPLATTQICIDLPILGIWNDSINDLRLFS